MEHGGDIYTNRGIELDFSVNLNPLGPPEEVRSALQSMLDASACYPDPHCRELRHALARKLEVSEEWVLCGNGASELLLAAAQAIRPAKVLIPVPTYQGYERAAAAAGAETIFHQLMEENGFEITDDIWQDIEALPAGSLLFVCNPNNPVGNCIREDLLQKIAEKCRSAGVYLLVDECYLELLPDEAARSMRHYLPRNPYLLIVRAFTKTYAMPGVRLGYLMASDQALIEKIHLQQPEWSVSMFAQKAGLAALSLDGTTNAYLASARDLIREERAYVCQRLRDLGAEVYDGEAGFVLFSCSRELYEPLRESGILIRRCDSMRGLEHADGSPQGAEGRPQDIDGRPHFYRIGLRGHGDNTRLMDRIQELLLR